jgi:hypothetical protein
MTSLNITHHVGIIGLPPIVTVDSPQEYVIHKAVSSLKSSTTRVQVSGLSWFGGKRERGGSRICLRLWSGFEPDVVVDQSHILVRMRREGQSSKGNFQQF